MTGVEAAVATIREGGLAVIPTDTVYGLVCTPYREEPVRCLSDVKRRDPAQPIAIMAASVDWLLECLPELRGRAATQARAMLPGPYTLVLPNPAKRYPWLTGSHPGTIGVRVPELDGSGKSVLDGVGAVAATSANLHGGPNPARAEDVPDEIRTQATVVDGGVLPGIPSTVVDLTGSGPRVLREGSVPAYEVLVRLDATLAVRAGE